MDTDYKIIYSDQSTDTDLVDILCFAAHPDDIELATSATLFKHKSHGKTIAVVDLTLGELGTRGNAKIREEEAVNSAKILGLTKRINLQLEDGFFENSKENKLKIIKQIRYFKPKVILSNALNDRHIDHGRASQLVSEACFLSGLAKIETQWENNPQNAYRPKAVYHYIQDRYLEPDFVIDVTDFFEKKMECIFAFKSQFYNPNSKEPETPISSEEFIEFLKARMSEFGRRIGVKYAEGFQVERTLGVNDFFQLM